MAMTFQEFLKKLIEDDKRYLANANEASKRAEDYCNSLVDIDESGLLSPYSRVEDEESNEAYPDNYGDKLLNELAAGHDADEGDYHYEESDELLGLADEEIDDTTTIKYANSMRIIELGEAVNNLINNKTMINNETITPDTVLATGITARLITTMRKQLAHPEQYSEILHNFEEIYARKEELREKLEKIGDSNYDDPVIQSNISVAIDAIRALKSQSEPAHLLSYFLLRDAGNYMRTYLGSNLNNLSLAGKKTLDTKTFNLCSGLIDDRILLSHSYQKNCNRIAITSLGNAPVFNEEDLTPQNYRTQLLGDRTEPTLETIMQNWILPDNDCPQTLYSAIERRIVVKRISDMTTTPEVPVNLIQQCNYILEIAKRAVKRPEDKEIDNEIKRFMLSHFPDGLSAEINSFLNVLSADAARNYWMQKYETTDSFEQIKHVLTTALSQAREGQQNLLQLGPAIQKLGTALSGIALPENLTQERKGKLKPEKTAKCLLGFIRERFELWGYNEEHVNTISKEINLGINALLEPSGMEIATIGRLDPATRQILSDIVEGLKPNERNQRPKTLWDVPSGIRDQIVNNTEAAMPLEDHKTAAQEALHFLMRKQSIYRQRDKYTTAEVQKAFAAIIKYGLNGGHNERYSAIATGFNESGDGEKMLRYAHAKYCEHMLRAQNSPSNLRSI